MPMIMETQPPESVHDPMAAPSVAAKDEPRKRSKVSRACDACRRKKIRCNAEYSTTLSRVTRVCTSCEKMSEACLFSRVPLKRGPMKGFTRESDHQSNIPIENGTSATFYHHANNVNASATTNGNKNGNTNVNANGSFKPFARLEAPALTSAQIKAYRPRSKSIDVAAMKYSYADPVQLTPPSPLSQASGSLRLPSLVAAPAPRTTPGHPIVLPPIVGTHPSPHPVKFSQPLAPHASFSLPGANSQFPLFSRTLEGPEQNKIHGPLWKVPYEMPASLTPRSAASSPGGTSAAGYNSRRSSVDSVSSVSTTCSARLPSLVPPASVGYASDSDEMDPSSGLASPRGSVSSVSSFNGKVSLLQLAQPAVQNGGQNGHMQYSVLPGGQNQNQNQNQTQNHGFVGGFQAPMQTGGLQFQHSREVAPEFADQMSRHNRHGSHSFANPQLSQPAPFSNVSGFDSSIQNLPIYYANFHGSFPILPHDKHMIPSLLACSGSSVKHLFISALDHLIHHQSVPFESVKELLVQVAQVYPFNEDAPVENGTLILMFAAMSMLNYAMLLRGDHCSLGLSFANGAFSQVKVFQLFMGLSPAKLSTLGPDDIQVYLPRLLFLAHIIDSCHALSSGGQFILAQSSSVFFAKLRPTFQDTGHGFLETIELGLLFERIQRRNEEEAFSNSARSKRSSLFHSMPPFGDKFLGSPILALQKDMYELFDFALEVCGFFKACANAHFEDEHTKEHIHDYQLKTTRLVKKLSHSILEFAKCLSNTSSNSPVASQQVSPFLNINFGSALKLIKVSKSLIDALVSHAADNEIVSRSMKILSDLSMATHLLAGQLNQGSRAIPKTPNAFLEGNSSIFQPVTNGPGVSAVEAFKRRLEIYGLNFNNTVCMTTESEKNSIEAWGAEFSKAAQLLLSTEGSSGWC